MLLNDASSKRYGSDRRLHPFRVAKRFIKAGDTFTEENITVKRPGTGINPMKWFDVIGKRATRNYEKDEQIEL